MPPIQRAALMLVIVAMSSAQLQGQDVEFRQVSSSILPVDFLPAESVERMVVVDGDTIVVTRQSVFKTRVLRCSNGKWTETFRYGKLDSNIIFSGHQRVADGVMRFPCLTRSSMLTAAHGRYAELSVDLNGRGELKIQQDTFQTLLTGTTSVTASANGYLMSARQRGGAQLPEPGKHLLYQFESDGSQRKVGAINAGTPEVVDGGFSIACFTDGSSLVSGVSTFSSTPHTQAWVASFDEALKQRPSTAYITDGSERVLATHIESQPQNDTVLSYTLLQSSSADTSIVLSFFDRVGAVVRSVRLSLPSGFAFYPTVIRRHAGTWTAAGYIQTKELGESVIYAAWLRIRLDGENITCTGYVDQETPRASFVSYWTDPSGQEYLGGYSMAGMIVRAVSETVSSIHESSTAATSIIHLNQLLWDQADGPKGCVRLYDMQGRSLGEVSSAAEIVMSCSQHRFVWVVSDERSWLVATQ